MAITKVGTYRNPPEDITDYEAIVAHLNAYTRQIGNQGMILTEWTNTSGTPAIAMGSYISHGGVLYVVDSEEAVALPVSDGTYYLMVAASGDTLALSWISSLSGYAWNAIANGLYHADESQVLPYQVVKNGALIEKYKMLNPWQNNNFTVVNYLGRYRELYVSGDASIGGAISADNFESKSVLGVSLDSLVKSGFYRVSSSTGLPPSASDSGTLFVTQGGDTITQIYGDYSTGFTYYRTGNPPEVGGQGSWKSWRSNNIIAGLSYAVGASHQYLPAIEIGDSISFTCSQAQGNIFLYTPAGGSYVLWIKQAYTISTGTTYSYSWTPIAGSTPVPMTPQGNYNYTMYLTRVS